MLQICSVVAFSQTLRRYTSLNHLAQAARAVLQNPSQISQMLSDLNRVDFANVQVKRIISSAYPWVIIDFMIQVWKIVCVHTINLNMHSVVNERCSRLKFIRGFC